MMKYNSLLSVLGGRGGILAAPTSTSSLISLSRHTSSSTSSTSPLGLSAFGQARHASKYANPEDPSEFHLGSNAGYKPTLFGAPLMFMTTSSHPTWQPSWEYEYEVVPRDEFGVPATIPPEVSTTIKHIYHVPPQFYPTLKRFGDDDKELKSYMDSLSSDQMDHQMFEEMFYSFSKPLKVYRDLIPMPFRTDAEISREDEVKWESAWLTFLQKVAGDYRMQTGFREYLTALLVGLYFGLIYNWGHKQWRSDIKLFYLEAPEHKINWVTPRGDL